MMVRSRSSRRRVPIQRSANGLAAGTRTGVRKILRPSVREDLVEVAGELAGAVSQKCSGVGEPLWVTHEQVAGGLGGPCAGRVGCDGAVEDLAGGDVDAQQQVAAAQQGCVDGREAACDGAGAS